MNPYEVLGIHEGASEAEIKKAYKEQVKKYHPDKYQDNPLYELAEEKLREVNEAYDMLMNGRSSSGSGSYSYSSSQSSDFMQVRRYIDMGNLQAAADILNRSSVRNAEWYFLSGMLSYKRGWYDDAVNKLRTAHEMEPGNAEYSQSYIRLVNMGGQFQNQAYGRGYNSADDACCQFLQCYLCFECCCNG